MYTVKAHSAFPVVDNILQSIFLVNIEVLLIGCFTHLFDYHFVFASNKSEFD